MSKSTIFRNKLNELNIYMEENQDEYGVFFRTTQSIKNGGNVLIAVSFNKDETLIDLNVFNIAKIDNPLKKEELHKLINELNKNYRYTKFTEHEGNITAQYSYDIFDDFDPSRTMNHIVLLLNTVEDAYPKFMKLQWA